MRALAAALGLVLALPGVASAAEPPASFQGGPSHSGLAEAAIAPPLGKRWVRADIGRPSTPIVYDGRVFVTTVSGGGSSGTSMTTALHALDAATGRSLWSVPGVVGRVSAAGGLVLTGAGGQIVARDAGSGAIRWTAPAGEEHRGAGEPVGDDELVFVPDDGITAYRTADGLRLWHASGSGSDTSAAAADGERAYALGCDSTLAAERHTGVSVWEHQTGCPSSFSAPVVAGGRVWGPTAVHRAVDGAVLGPWSGGPPAIAQDRTVAADRGGALRAQDFEGRRLWEARFPAARQSSAGEFGQPLIVGATVYALGTGGLVLGYDLASGREVWRSSTRVGDVPYTGSSSDAPAEGLAARGDRLIVPFPDKLVGYGPGADAPGVDPDPWRDPAAVQLALGKPTPAKLRFGRRTAMKVTYKRTVGSDEGGLDLVLEADPFPFGHWQDVRKVSFDEAEYQGVSIRPDRNTRFRLRYDGVTPPKYSEVAAVQVDVDFRVRYRYLSRTRLRARLTLRAPADRLTRDRLKVPFYFFRHRTGRSRRLGVERLRRTGATTARGTIVVRVPRRFGRRDSVFPCLPEKRDDGFGRFIRAQRVCGRKRF